MSKDFSDPCSCLLTVVSLSQLTAIDENCEQFMYLLKFLSITSVWEVKFEYQIFTSRVPSKFYVLLTVDPCVIFLKWSQLGTRYFLVYLFQLLYMFPATMSPASGEFIVFIRHCYFSLFMSGCLVCWLGWDYNQQTRQPPIQNKKYQCRIDTVNSPDPGHVVAGNMYRNWNKYTKK